MIANFQSVFAVLVYDTFRKFADGLFELKENQKLKVKNSLWHAFKKSLMDLNRAGTVLGSCLNAWA